MHGHRNLKQLTTVYELIWHHYSKCKQCSDGSLSCQNTKRPRNPRSQIRLCVNVRKETVSVIYPRHYVLLYTATFNQLINVKICDLLSMKLCIFYMFIYIYIYIYMCVCVCVCKMGTGSFPGVKCGRGVLLTPHLLLVPRSWKSTTIPLPTLWATPGL